MVELTHRQKVQLRIIIKSLLSLEQDVYCCYGSDLDGCETDFTIALTELMKLYKNYGGLPDDSKNLYSI